jgi:hypothetical protein
VSLPPQPVLGHWGTWLDAMVWYCEKYSTTDDIVYDFNSNEASSIKIVKNFFSAICQETWLIESQTLEAYQPQCLTWRQVVQKCMTLWFW